MAKAKPQRERVEPDTWAEAAERAGHSWGRYARSDALEHRIAQLDAELDAQVAATTDTIVGLTERVPEVAKRAMGQDPSPAWAILVGALVVAAWDHARRLGGYGDAVVARSGPKGPCRFGSVGAALAFAVYSEHRLGIGPGPWVPVESDTRGGGKVREYRLDVADDREEHVRERQRVLMRGRLVPAGGRRRKRSALERALLEHLDDATGVTRAPSGGFLPVEFMPAQQSRSGSTGGARGQAQVHDRVDVLRAVRRSGLGRIDFALLVASDVGVFVPEVEWLVRNGLGQFRRMRAAELADKLNAARPELDPLTAQQVGYRIADARYELQLELAMAGLVPKPRARRMRCSDSVAPIEPSATSALEVE